MFAETRDDVIDLVNLCAKHDSPIIPFGTGSSLEGHVNAPHGGVSLDCSRMNAILAVNAEDLDCVVEPGVTRAQLNELSARQRPLLPDRPGRRRLARRNGRHPRLGHQRGALRHDEGPRAVARRRHRRRDLFAHRHARQEVLGGLRPHPSLRRRRRHARGHRRGHAEALGPARGGVGRDLLLSRRALGLRRDHPDHPVGAADRPDRTPRRADRARLQHLFASRPARGSRCCSSSSTARKAASPSRRRGSARSSRKMAAGISSGRPGPRSAPSCGRRATTSFSRKGRCAPAPGRSPPTACVPISRLADCVEETLADIAASGLIAPIVGHVGDGNFHVTPLVDMANPHEIEAAEAFASRLAHRAIAMGGTCTGEHGVGQKKIAYMDDEHGPAAARSDAPRQGGLRSAEPVQPGQGFCGVGQRFSRKHCVLAGLVPAIHANSDSR